VHYLTKVEPFTTILPRADLHDFGGRLGTPDRLLSPNFRHVLSTFMSEVSAIMNGRPLPISSDPEAPSLLSPSTNLPQKGHNLSTPMIVTGFIDRAAMKSQVGSKTGGRLLE
jgi:hypothetical protein